MHEQIEERCVRIGQYIVETGATVRQAAARFGLSKSSVHKDMGERLPRIHHALAQDVRGVLAYHKSVRHLRGGEATRTKYELKRRIAAKEGVSRSTENIATLHSRSGSAVRRKSGSKTKG